MSPHSNQIPALLRGLLAGVALLISPTLPADPWPQASPESQGIDASLLAQIAPAVNRGEHANINSIVLIRNGQLVYENYFRGYDAEQLVPVHSVTKSVGATLIGIAEHQGLLSLEEPLLDFFPQYAQVSDPLNPSPLPVIANMSANKRAITLQDLLTMRSGLDWDEWAVPYATPGNVLSDMIVSSPDWSKHILDLPASLPPDSDFAYNTGLSNLMSGALFTAAGLDGAGFAITHLFDALGIEDYHWEQTGGPASATTGIFTSPEGFFPLGNGLWLTPRDMARIGQLYLQNGRWNGQRLLAEDWRARAWTRFSNEQSDPDIFDVPGSGYGFQWWISELNYLDGVPIYYANGWGHQFIIVIPSYDLVYVQTADDYNGEPTQAGAILRNFILPAMSADSFEIQYGLTGSWYNPQTPGQGFLVEVIPSSEQIVVYWFTYDETVSNKFGGMGQRWFTAVGNYSGDRVSLQVAQTTGGIFDDPAPTTSTIVGSAELVFDGCRDAHFSFVLDALDLAGEIPLARLTPNPMCVEN